MTYKLTDLLGKQSNMASNGAGLSTEGGVLEQVREYLRTKITRKFEIGETSTIATAATHGYRSLSKAAQDQAKVEGCLIEHGVSGSPRRDAIFDVANRTFTSPAYVSAVAERMVRANTINFEANRINIKGIEVPELDPHIAIKLSQYVQKGVFRLSNLDSDVMSLKSMLKGHPFLNIIDYDGFSYGLFEYTNDKNQWISHEINIVILELGTIMQPTEIALMTMFIGEPIFPEDYLSAPDYIPDYIYACAGKLHDRATRKRMLIRSRNHRVSIIGERVIGTHFGHPFTLGACPDYDDIEVKANEKPIEKIWGDNRLMLLQGIALEILGVHDGDEDLSTPVEALVDIASGPERYEVEKIRDRLRGGQLSDASVKRIMTLAGRKGLMGTSLGSHYRLYENSREGD
jgi:hypothetical protein